MLPENLANINLLPEFEKQSKAGAIIVFILLFVILVGFIFIGFTYFTTKSSLTSAKAEQNTLNTEVDALRDQLQVLQNNNAVASLEDSVNFVENYNFPTSVYIENLVSLLPENAYLTGYNYSTLQAGISTGFESLDKVANYTTALTISDYNVDARLNNVVTNEFDDKEEEDKGYDFNELFRYQANFSLDIDKHALKGKERTDE